MLERVAYLNAGTFGPLPRGAVETITSRVRRDLEEGRVGLPYFVEAIGLRESLREALARLVGAAHPYSIALTTSATEGCDTVVAGLRLRAGDEVVTTDVEHPGLLGALHAWRVHLRVARLRARPPAEALAALEAEITPRTRLVALSHVAYTTGAVLPVRELAGRSFRLLVDGAQAVGAIPVDVEELGCDFYAASGQKWLLGPDATGFLFVRPERVHALDVSFPSYISWQDPAALVPWPDARRFESAWIPPASVAGLLASLRFADEVGEERFGRARAMAERCRELVAERADVVTAPDQATLVTFRPARDAEKLVGELTERAVVVRDVPGHGWIRASCGFWTSDEDLERLAAAL